jgi:hypothetical protein
MDWFDIYAIDALESARALKKRVKSHPLFTLWFFVLCLVFCWFMLRIYSISLEIEGGPLSDITPSNILLILFVVFFAKSVSDTQRRINQNKALVFNMSQPIGQNRVLYGKLFYQVAVSVWLFSAILGLIVAVTLGFDYNVPGDFWFVLISVLVVVFGTITGLVFAVFNVFPIKRRLALMMCLMPLFVVFYSILTYASFAGETLFLVMALLVIASLGEMVIANRVFLEAWNIGTHPGQGIRRSLYTPRDNGRKTVLTRFMAQDSHVLLKREVTERFRSGQFLGMVITLVAITYGTIYAVNEFADTEAVEMRYGYLVKPLIVGMGIFAAALLEPGISTLASIGREGKNMWILRSSPIRGSTVLSTKAVASLVSVPFIAFGPGIFPSIFAGFNYDSTLFSAIAALTMVFLCTGVASWFSAKYPNFDESVKGYPDIMTLYMYAMVCLVFVLMFITLPFFIWIYDHVLGMLAIIFFADLAALVLYLGIVLGGAELDRTEVK